MRYLSVCSGIEAASVAWESLGWTPVAFAEIERFPSQVLAHHYPEVPNLGDMTRYKEWDIDRAAVDLIVGGTPCQSFSVAGLRKGLEDPRGNLALTFLGMVDYFKPEWVIWENVPGVLSSSGGRDFGSFLGALGQLGYGFCYRVLDAQYFGVPQRRRRVFVVAHSSGDSRRASQVLFEPESLSGNHYQGKQARQSITGRTFTGPVSSKWAKGTGGPAGDECYNLVPILYQNNQTDARLKEEPHTSQTVLARWGTGGGNTPLVKQPIALAENTIGRQPMNGGNGNGFTVGGPMYTLNATGVHGVAHTFKVRGGCEGGGKGYLGQDDKAFTISTSQDQYLSLDIIVRRLTPTECERLQGFSDGYTDIMPNTPDGPRYKALGNSMAVPVMQWIGTRINECH